MNLSLVHELPFPVRPSEPQRYNAYLLNVDFQAPGGQSCSSVGGGESVAEALAAARGSLPAGPAWSVAGWNHLYGE